MKKYYFIGIGGIGMSALAQYFKDRGDAVSGSDRDASPVTELLEKKGIHVVIGQKAENVPADAETVVYTDSVPADNPERTRATELGIPQKSYFQMLGDISKKKRTIAVAGTKGKTTTTAMVARILSEAGASPTAVVGSIVKDFSSNFLAGGSDIFVVESDEYKGHFLELAPHIAVVTNLEWDHTDFYPTMSDYQNAFRKFIGSVPANGRIITDPNNPNIAACLGSHKASIIDYTKEPEYTLKMPGAFNQMNARAAAAAARALLPDIQDEVLRFALSDFNGTWRRFDYKGRTAGGASVYDDYAHNPMSVRAALETMRSLVKGKILVAFHPHLYSRTRDLLDEFSTAFSDADKVFIAPIYAAREVDDGTISSEILAERIRATGVDATALGSFDAIEKALSEAGPGDVVMTMGAGDIYKVADKITVAV